MEIVTPGMQGEGVMSVSRSFLYLGVVAGGDVMEIPTLDI
jgi:hypothetical protein